MTTGPTERIIAALDAAKGVGKRNPSFLSEATRRVEE
jgi:hypothetical protein